MSDKPKKIKSPIAAAIKRRLMLKSKGAKNDAEVSDAENEAKTDLKDVDQAQSTSNIVEAAQAVEVAEPESIEPDIESENIAGTNIVNISVPSGGETLKEAEPENGEKRKPASKKKIDPADAYASARATESGDRWVERVIPDGIDEQTPYAWRMKLDTTLDRKSPLNKLLAKLTSDNKKQET